MVQRPSARFPNLIGKRCFNEAAPVMVQRLVLLRERKSIPTRFNEAAPVMVQRHRQSLAWPEVGGLASMRLHR